VRDIPNVPKNKFSSVSRVGGGAFSLWYLHVYKIFFLHVYKFFLDQLKKLSQKECYRHLTKPRKNYFVIGGTPPNFKYAFPQGYTEFHHFPFDICMSKRLRFGNQIVTFKKRLPNKITFEVTREKPWGRG